jgi:Protein of unknown function (DUF3617)
MKALTLAVSAGLLALSSGAHAEGYMKAGLWEAKVIRMVRDGQDQTAKMADAQAKMQASLAKMPPAQRAQIEGMMKGSMSGGAGTIRMCVSAAMAAREKPMVDPNSHCEPTTFNRSGNKVTFEYNCKMDARTSVGKGESIINGDTITNRVNSTVTDPSGTHTTDTEMQMTYLGADCQGVKPADEMMNAGAMKK